jgi:hypothetical protein
MGLEDGSAGGPGRGEAIAGQAGHHLAVGAQGVADLPFYQAEDQQGQAGHHDLSGDAAVGLQEQGSHREGAFEVAVAAFDDVLAFVAASKVIAVRTQAPARRFAVIALTRAATASAVG